MEREEAEDRANLDSRQQGWTILGWDWHPDTTRMLGPESGVLVVRFCALAQLPQT
jgi:hypothetical protein